MTPAVRVNRHNVRSAKVGSRVKVANRVRRVKAVRHASPVSNVNRVNNASSANRATPASRAMHVKVAMHVASVVRNVANAWKPAMARLAASVVNAENVASAATVSLRKAKC